MIGNGNKSRKALKSIHKNQKKELEVFSSSSQSLNRSDWNAISFFCVIFIRQSSLTQQQLSSLIWVKKNSFLLPNRPPRMSAEPWLVITKRNLRFAFFTSYIYLGRRARSAMCEAEEVLRPIYVYTIRSRCSVTFLSNLKEKRRLLRERTKSAAHEITKAQVM